MSIDAGVNGREWYPEINTWEMVVELVELVRRERPAWRLGRVTSHELDPGREGFEVTFWKGPVRIASFRARPPDANVLLWLDEHNGGPAGSEPAAEGGEHG